jgi:FMN-dependent NADH-azoreductase
VIYRDLAATVSRPLDAEWIQSSFTPEAARSPEQKAVLTNSDQLIAELIQADEYVVGVAMHNFSIPSVLKLWIDQVLRAGRTFSYGTKGPQGLLLSKKAKVLTASGGVYEAGTPAAAANFVDPYLKTIFGLMGVTDVQFVTAGGAARLMKGSIDRATFLHPVLTQVRAIAA